MLLIGDFNIPTVTSAAYQTLAARIVVPSARAGVFGTDLAQGKRYDQILVVPHPEASAHARFTGAGGALDFLRGVAPGAISGLNTTEFTHAMSDHLRLWAE